MSNTKTSSLFITFDRSGSMGIFQKKTVIDGLLDLIAQQENIEHIVLIMFSTDCEVVFNGKTLTRKVIETHFNTEGCTAMNDAFLKALSYTEDDTSDNKIILFLTDGEENSSKANITETKAAIIKAQEKGVEMLSLGVSPTVAEKYGLPTDQCIEFQHSEEGMREVMFAASQVMRSHTSGEGERGFTQNHRTMSSQLVENSEDEVEDGDEVERLSYTGGPIQRTNACEPTEPTDYIN
jgi:hypothetical protein